MSDVFRALSRAIWSQLHPRMLWLSVWPFLIALFVCATIGWLFHERALTALHDLLFGLRWINTVEHTFAFFGFGELLQFLVPVLYLFLIFSMTVALTILLIGFVSMPAIITHVAQRNYRDLESKGGINIVGSLFNASWVTLVFAIGWLLTMPFWIIVPLAIVLPVLWWGWLTARILRFDALSVHATLQERRELFRHHAGGFFFIGIVIGLLNFVPPLFLFTPTLGGLAFTHYGLQKLRRLRASPASSAVSQLTMTHDT